MNQLGFALVRLSDSVIVARAQNLPLMAEIPTEGAEGKFDRATLGAIGAEIGVWEDGVFSARHRLVERLCATETPDGQIVVAESEAFDGLAIVVTRSYAAVPLPVPASISDRQLFQQLAILGEITKDEALAAVKTGEIPGVLQDFLDTLPAERKFGAEMLLSGATVFERNHPMTELLRDGFSWSSEEADNLWRAASSL